MTIQKQHVRGGYPVGNFGICAQITSSGEFLSRVLVNPSREGPWLERYPGGSLCVEVGGVRLKTSEFARIDAEIAFPFANLTFSDERLDGLELHIQTFAPVIAFDAFSTSLPVLLSSVTLRCNADRERNVRLTFALDDTEDSVGSNAGSLPGEDRLTAGFGASGPSLPSPMASLTVPAGGSVTARFVYAYFDPEGFYSRRLSSVEALVQFACSHFDGFYQQTRAFSSLLPTIGDPEIDRWMRWYLPAGIYLTRITRSMVITMGYCEFNQRDSYWTSWLHLVFWPDLELQMLQETARHMRPDGKVPTTILPVIEREDDLDINCYFVLRVWRLWRFRRDLEAVRELFPAVQKALTWLKGRDTDGDGLIEQRSYWADWKDVPGVEGRKHAPHFEFTWLGSQRGAGEMAQALGLDDAAREYAQAADVTEKAINADVADGGLWTRSFYTSVWYDGRQDAHVQQDQLAGAAWDLIPPDRLLSIYEALRPNETPWGIRDTYPYRSPSNNEPGDYHNGGVWPFLNFMDALGRYKAGFPTDASEIIRRVGRFDLETFGDFTPHEYLHGETGENLGPAIQSWNADLFAAITWGALGVEVLGENHVQIAPRVGSGCSFETAIVLPQGLIWLKEQSEEGRLTLSIRSEARSDLQLRIGFWREEPGEEAEGLGNGFLIWQNTSLPALGAIEMSEPDMPKRP